MLTHADKRPSNTSKSEEDFWESSKPSEASAEARLANFTSPEDERTTKSPAENGSKHTGDNSSDSSLKTRQLMKSVKAVTSMYKVGSLITPCVSKVDEAYRLDGVVNWGRTSVVYRATRIVDNVPIADRSFALKIMWFDKDVSSAEKSAMDGQILSLPAEALLSQAGKSDARLRAERELEALLSVQAIPHVIRLNQAFETSRHGVFVFEYIHGSARMLINTFGGLHEKDYRFYLRDILTALTQMHNIDDLSSVVHGDVKPDNILITDKNEAVLIDFGSAFKCPRKQTPKDSHVRYQGSLPYTPPECLDFVIETCFHHAKREDDAQHRSDSLGTVRGKNLLLTSDSTFQPSIDVWSLGISALDFVFGVSPYHLLCEVANDSEQALRLLTSEGFLSCLWECLTNVVSDTFVDFLSKCLEPKASLRPSARLLMEHPFIWACSNETRPNTLRNVYVEHRMRRASRSLLGGTLTQKGADGTSAGKMLIKKAYTEYLARVANQESSPLEATSGAITQRTLSALNHLRYSFQNLVFRSSVPLHEERLAPGGMPKLEEGAIENEEVAKEETIPETTDPPALSDTQVFQASLVLPEEPDSDEGIRDGELSSTARMWLREDVCPLPPQSTQSSLASRWRRWIPPVWRVDTVKNEARDVFKMDFRDSLIEVDRTHIPSTSQETVDSCVTACEDEFLTPSAVSTSIHEPVLDDSANEAVVQNGGGLVSRLISLSPLHLLSKMRTPKEEDVRSAPMEAESKNTGPRSTLQAVMTEEDFALTGLGFVRPKTD
eukprot:Blabericola_migrator_1__2173@NODE_15_length_23605_cov_67_423868_g12_i0_p4_GENE_NODE_15_length_23605_cov_67_423868_g12_i0NODE_15_length_23605_cov_67_423868_g12_i0_p4_ORF_typecomplete_len778_score99_32Pkinase/PF00069_25/2_8e37Pkinase_Tyr/PF07714_17/8_3e20Kdo/PF06293_14/4_6e10RIO1/PF01163_22/7_8e09Kinaselike/PF14531_6/3_8e08WaaY/PF06176_11/6_3e03WaaY/PF06176_11/2e08Pkinase_fungal/PF17667_1/1_1e07APH/PF01636_23/3_6e06EcKinase/PF02958_20/0_00049EcKinase/PF02958_20/1_2e03Seadorna_VP7/PF07387_11/0_0003